MSDVLSFLRAQAARLRTLGNRWGQRVARGLAVGAAAATSAAFAVLPQPPTTTGSTAAQGDYMGILRDNFGNSIGLIALIIGGAVFIVVASYVIGAYREMHAGKGTVGDLVQTFVLGSLVLVFVIYLLTQAVSVIATSGTFAGG